MWSFLTKKSLVTLRAELTKKMPQRPHFLSKLYRDKQMAPSLSESATSKGKMASFYEQLLKEHQTS